MKQIEREAIILNCAWEMIDEMVSFSIFESFVHPEPTSLTFNGSAESTLFVILLGDFLSQISKDKGGSMPLDLVGITFNDNNIRSTDRTFLYQLRQVCDAPQLSSETSELRKSIDVFADWLEGDFVACDVYFARLRFETNLRVERLRYIKMCGDIAKHNLTRLSINAVHLGKLLKDSGNPVTDDEVYLAIDDFFEWFYENIFQYHSSRIAEYLNNIRWEIYCYLHPEFERSWREKDGLVPGLPGYEYRVPKEFTEPVAKAMYWNIMNRVRSGVCVPRFEIPEILKRRH